MLHILQDSCDQCVTVRVRIMTPLLTLQYI